MGIIILLAGVLIIIITLIGIFSWDIKLFFRSISWRHRGRPMIKYPGFTCGCCGRGWKIPFEIRDYESCGKYWDTWGLCPEGEGCYK